MLPTRHGIRGFRRVREVDMSALRPRTREHMMRNHIFFEYVELRDPRAVAGRMDSITRPNCGITLQEFMDQLHLYLETVSTGLYYKSRGGDAPKGRSYWNLYFELESDLDHFLKHFLVLHKLSA